MSSSDTFLWHHVCILAAVLCDPQSAPLLHPPESQFELLAEMTPPAAFYCNRLYSRRWFLRGLTRQNLQIFSRRPTRRSEDKPFTSTCCGVDFLETLSWAELCAPSDLQLQVIVVQQISELFISPLETNLSQKLDCERVRESFSLQPSSHS